ncbi:hypothetical protein RDV89_02345 [Nocardioides zeae]|uniref:Sodium/calcium exchanger membrane region domain-containing protein n=1 Tax=Nocardioides imazamoxiresistens TaxID=3231893 RepID=A0ABU3PSM5_9ACTN|nr:hypothetical protein [Nocardioides zeae]MDT9591891.1 hypothetical protein [Nocardioides zeae]
MDALFDATGSPGLAAAVVFVVGAAVTVLGSIRLATLGDVLADRTGWGEALFGAVFFGVMTSMSGIVMTAATAADGRADLAYSNAVGGIAAQTVAIAVADLAYRRSNLEHAAASVENLMFGCLLIALLSLALLATFAPEATLLGLHPISGVMVVVYLGGLHLIRRRARTPMWTPVDTPETIIDQPEADDAPQTTAQLWAQFVAVGAVVVVAGWAIAEAAGVIVDVTGLGAGFVGIVLMGVVNAIPETVTTIAAVRRGATTLAVAAILGGNSLDALNLAVGDAFYGGGSIYHAASDGQLFVTVASLFMTAVLLGGLLVRQRTGPGRVGFEGVGLAVAYAGVVAVQVL